MSQLTWEKRAARLETLFADMFTEYADDGVDAVLAILDRRLADGSIDAVVNAMRAGAVDFALWPRHQCRPAWPSP